MKSAESVPVRRLALVAIALGTVCSCLGPSSLTAPPRRFFIPLEWTTAANFGDRYNASEDPQPVCISWAGTNRVLLFTNYDYYPSKQIGNNRSAIRVGSLQVGGGYMLMSSATPGDPHSLPGQWQQFATAAVPGLPGGDRVFLFGGRNTSVETNAYYSYTPATGFTYAGTMPGIGNITGYRSGMAAATANGRIYLFGGQWGGTAITNQVVRFDPATGTFAQMQSMPQPLYNLRAVTRRVGGNDYIYLVGGRSNPGGNRNAPFYRYDVAQNKMIALTWTTGGPPSQVHLFAAPTIALDANGELRVISPSGYKMPGPTWSGIDGWILRDTYGGPNDGRATLVPDSYSVSARARDLGGATKCGPVTFLIGGTWAGGPNWHSRDAYVDKLGEPFRTRSPDQNN